jgi:hypothetical protein
MNKRTRKIGYVVSLISAMVVAFFVAGPARGAGSPSLDVAVYPGAVLDDQRTSAVRSKHPEQAVYRTQDSFEKVEAFYRKLGGENLKNSDNVNNVSDDAKMVLLGFPGKKYCIAVVWMEGAKSLGTVITFIIPTHR